MDDKGIISISELISIPVKAACDANIDIAKSINKFLKVVGIDEHNKAKTKEIIYQRLTQDTDNKPVIEEIKINIPMLSIVSVPNLQIDEAEFEFCLEIKEIDEKKEDKKQNIGATVSAFKDNTRNTDNLPKCYVKLKASKGEMPEGLARLLDIMNASIIPQRINSFHIDEHCVPVEEKLERKFKSEQKLEDKINSAKGALSLLENDYQSEKKELRCLIADENGFDYNTFFKEACPYVEAYITKSEGILCPGVTKDELLGIYETGHTIYLKQQELKRLISTYRTELREAKLKRILSK